MTRIPCQAGLSVTQSGPEHQHGVESYGLGTRPAPLPQSMSLCCGGRRAHGRDTRRHGDRSDRVVASRCGGGRLAKAGGAHAGKAGRRPGPGTGKASWPYSDKSSLHFGPFTDEFEFRLQSWPELPFVTRLTSDWAGGLPRSYGPSGSGRAGPLRMQPGQTDAVDEFVEREAT